MNSGVLLSALAGVSILTSLTVEGIKKILDEQGKTYKSNLLAAIVAVALSIGAVILYVLYFSVPFSVQIIVITICFAFLSWLASMVGFDKVKQLLEQFKG
jgi:hypothetical protein